MEIGILKGVLRFCGLFCLKLLGNFQDPAEKGLGGTRCPECLLYRSPGLPPNRSARMTLSAHAQSGMDQLAVSQDLTFSRPSHVANVLIARCFRCRRKRSHSGSGLFGRWLPVCKQCAVHTQVVKAGTSHLRPKCP